MVEFLYTGQFSCNKQYLAARVISNLQEFLGFSKFISISKVQNVSSEIENENLLNDEIPTVTDINLDSDGSVKDKKDKSTTYEYENEMQSNTQASEHQLEEIDLLSYQTMYESSKSEVFPINVLSSDIKDLTSSSDSQQKDSKESLDYEGFPTKSVEKLSKGVVDNEDITKEKESQNSHFKCEFCDKRLNSKIILKRHRLWNCKRIVSRIDESGEQTFIRLDKKSLSIEEARNDLQQSFLGCKFCSKQFSSLRSLEKHTKDRCKNIDRKVLNQINLPEVENEEPKKECEFLKRYGFCDRKTKRSLISNQGRRKSTRMKLSDESRKQLVCYCKGPLKPFSCPECPNSYCRKSNMLKHLETIHKWSNKDKKKLKYNCSKCKLSFWKKIELDAHEKIHERTYNCSICQMIFKYKQSLQRHKDYTHEGKQKDLCEICKKEFLGKIYLIKHIDVVHKGKKPYLCSTCGYATAFSGQMKQHVQQKHEGKCRNQPFTCHICGQQCDKKAHLDIHIGMVHEKKKSVKCEVCGKGFFNVAQLSKHQISHDNARPYECKKCAAAFKRKDHLKTHLKTIHSSIDMSSLERE